MENSPRKRMSAGVALVFLGPTLVGALSGCNSNCDENRSTLTTSDDCGTGRRRTGGGGFIGGSGFGRGGSFGAGRSSARSGGFGGFGRSFGAGG